MKILYGTKEIHIDVTDICFTKLLNKNIVTIMPGDLNRASKFSDPVYGILKSVFLEYDDGVIKEVDDTKMIVIDTVNKSIRIRDINDELREIHSKLKLNYGKFEDELPEQRLTYMYLTGNEKILEIGSNIGRNSVFIGNILRNNNNNNFVTLESDSNIVRAVIINRDLNGMTFHIENAALSKRKLIQKGWDTIPSDELIEGFKWVNTLTFEELKNKYNINFDTLVLDCEGAFYYILMDMPEILDNIKLIIMENDYWDFSKKKFVNEVLVKNNFYVDYVESGREIGARGPCMDFFFEVWKRKSIILGEI